MSFNSYAIGLVISGMQTGADIAGVVAAQRVGIPTGGMMPKGWKTEKGNRPDFKERFGATESSSTSYLPRTKYNAQHSDATIILSPNKHSSGTRKTIQYCHEAGKPFILLNPLTDPTSLAVEFILEHEPNVINVAGNRESVAQGLSKQGAAYLVTVFSEVKKLEKKTGQVKK